MTIEGYIVMIFVFAIAIYLRYSKPRGRIQMRNQMKPGTTFEEWASTLPLDTIEKYCITKKDIERFKEIKKWRGHADNEKRI